ncbi:DUF1947 domain-containing protein [Candidatus Micrarchaeota archaeon]|nr:DUF1947 domain-containing protein [Candidatus Micrarchaeota archaeon]
MKRKMLNKREIKELKLKGIEEISPKERVEIIENEFLSVDGKFVGFLYEEKWYPTLKNPSLDFKKIAVDMGAVKFVGNGADIMRPGIVKIEEGIEKEELVLIVDEKYGKNLALGIALFDFGEMREKKEGKVVKNIHYVGDKIWEFEK